MTESHPHGTATVQIGQQRGASAGRPGLGTAFDANPMVYLPTGRPDMTPTLAADGFFRRPAPTPVGSPRTPFRRLGSIAVLSALAAARPAQAVATTPCWRGTRRCAKQYFTVSTGRTLRRLTIVTEGRRAMKPPTRASRRQYASIFDAAARVGASTKIIRRWSATGHLAGYRMRPRLLRLHPVSSTGSSLASPGDARHRTHVAPADLTAKRSSDPVSVGRQP